MMPYEENTEKHAQRFVRGKMNLSGGIFEQNLIILGPLNCFETRDP